MERLGFVDEVVKDRRVSNIQREKLTHEDFRVNLQLLRFPFQATHVGADPVVQEADARMALYILCLPPEMRNKTGFAPRVQKWQLEKTQHITQYGEDSLFYLAPTDFLGRDPLRVLTAIDMLRRRKVHKVSQLVQISDAAYEKVFGEYEDFVPTRNQQNPTVKHLNWGMKRLAEAYQGLRQEGL